MKNLVRLFIGIFAFTTLFAVLGVWANAIHEFGPRTAAAFQVTLGVGYGATLLLAVVAFGWWAESE